LELEIHWLPDRESRKETEVIWDYYEIIWAINPDRKPTNEEYSACPKVFTCYCDGEKHPIRELGGRYHGKWFCSECIKFIDEWTAGTMIAWEAKRKKARNTPVSK
jgi:hypothetical protein